MSRAVDGVVEIFSPKAAARRKAFRMAYDAVDGSRTRKKRYGLGGSGDKHLTALTLGKLREAARDMSRNNPLARGLLKIERDGIVGPGVIVKSNTGDDVLDAELDAAWKEEMINSPCDVTGQFNFHKCLRTGFLSYRRDGDFAGILTDDGLQNIEGDQIGTPTSGKKPAHYEIKNGVAVSKRTGRVLGYYIGKPDRWGYIQDSSYRMYKKEDVHHMFNPDRFSLSRGEPALTASIDWIDKICDSHDAVLVNLKVQACFTMFVARSNDYGDLDFEAPEATDGSSSTGEDGQGNRLEKMEPGTILYGADGESAQGIGMNNPSAQFDSFMKSMLMMAARPLCMPMILVTGDFSGATFMNTRIAYQKVQDMWEPEQNDTLVPFARKLRMWKVAQWIEQGRFPNKAGIFGHVVRCRRWPYVDPYKEAMGDKVELANGTTNQTLICARKGLEFDEVAAQGGRDKALLKTQGILGDDSNRKVSMEDVGRGVRSGVSITTGEARSALGLPAAVPEDGSDLLRFNDQDVLNYHIENGILTINEARKRLGLKRVKWGDVPVRKAGVETVNPDGTRNKENEDEPEIDKDDDQQEKDKK